MSNPQRFLTNYPGLVTIITIVIFITCLITFTGCGGDDASKPTPNPTKKPAPVVKTAEPAVDGSVILLAQAQFIKKEDPKTGKQIPAPGPARLSVWTKTTEGWSEEIIEDPESDVFHKASWFKPVQGEPGILTIGAREAYLKLWRKNEKNIYVAETLWNPTFGGKNDRLRDFEIADVNDDGLDEICIATHDEGVVAVLKWLAGKYRSEELSRKPNTFVHEIEVGDVDGDGIIELFSTPSNPNKMDGSVQPGGIDMFHWDNNKWVTTQVDYMTGRHAKEILCSQLTDMSRPLLFTALEGEKIGGDTSGDTTKIRMYKFDGGKTITKSDIASLPGHLCRFLTMGDTDGDGKNELIASTNKNGIWRLDPTDNDKWKKTLIATGTSGFEHSTYLADLNNDGMDEIYVASDNQGQLRCYTWNGRGYIVNVIGKLKESTITFNLVAYKPQSKAR